MRWMKLEAQPSVPSLYFLLFSWNKAKIVYSVCFLNYPCNEKYPENKSSPNALKFKYIFSRIFENIWHWEHNRGTKHLATSVEGAPYPLGVPPVPHGPTVAPLHLFQLPHTPSSSQKNHQLAQTQVLAYLAAIFDLLAQSSIHETALGDCSSVCDSSNGPISFCSSALFMLLWWPCSWACMSNLFGPK